jgi:hypothetical protein
VGRVAAEAVRQHRDATGYGSTANSRTPDVVRGGEDKVAVEVETMRKQHSCLRREIMAHGDLQQEVARWSAISCRAESRAPVRCQNSKNRGAEKINQRKKKEGWG